MLYASDTLAGDVVQASIQSFPAATETCIPLMAAALTTSSKALKPFFHASDILYGAWVYIIKRQGSCEAAGCQCHHTNSGELLK